MKKKCLILAIALLVYASNSIGQQYGSFTDMRDGQTYKTVKIGTQTWMAQNLNFKTDSGSRCFGDTLNYCDVYGRLYTWEMAKNVCPIGWHLPSDEEWTNMASNFGPDSIAEYHLKEAGEKHWLANNGDNKSGFTGLPGGCFLFGGWVVSGFRTNLMMGAWWTATVKGKSFFLLLKAKRIDRIPNNQSTDYLSVRCVKN